MCYICKYVYFEIHTNYHQQLNTLFIFNINFIKKGKYKCIPQIHSLVNERFDIVGKILLFK